MEPVLSVFAIGVGLLIAYGLIHLRAPDPRLSILAERCGLEHVQRLGSPFGVALGAHDGLRIEVDIRASSAKGWNPLATHVRVSGGQPASLVIVGVGALGVPRWRFEVGDPSFDEVAILSGEPERLLRSRMDEETRAAVAEAVRLGAVLRDGAWTIEVEGMRDVERLALFVDALRVAAGAIAAGEGHTVAGRLRAIAEGDWRAPVRMRALGALLDAGEDEPDWLRARIEDDDPQVAIVAARALGEAGRSTLLDRLAHEGEALRRSAAVALAALPTDEHQERIEDALRSILVGGEDPEVIDALARFGTVASVPVLGALATPRAKAAIEAIQERVPAGRGGLSIVSALPSAGALSEARRDDTPSG